MTAPQRDAFGRRGLRSSPGDLRGVAPSVARTAVLVVTTLSAVWACGGRSSGADGAAEEAGAAPSPPPAWTDSAPGVAIDSLLRRIAGRVGGSRAEARDRLGEPGEERVRTVPNRHVEGAVDTLVRLGWPGLAARYHKSGANQREFLRSVTVTGDTRLERILPGPLRDREALRRALGDPDRVEGNRWIWVCCPGRPGARESLAARFRDGRAEALRAGYFVD